MTGNFDTEISFLLEEVASLGEHMFVLTFDGGVSGRPSSHFRGLDYGCKTISRSLGVSCE